MTKIIDYLKGSYDRNRLKPVGELTMAGLRVSIDEPVLGDVDLEKSFSFVFDRMPKTFYLNVKQVKIGEFPFLGQRQVDAVYKNGTIYLTNKHETEESIISDLVHEIAHSFEETNKQEIYGDNKIKNEFIAKRENFLHILKSHKLVEYPIKDEDFFEVEYLQRFDTFLYKTIGYEKIKNIIGNLFISPYAATCLREYFANAFEHFFIYDINQVKKISPSVYNKIISYLEF